MEELAMKCFQVISNVGMARSSFIEAIHKAKEGKFDEAMATVEEGKKQFREGHKVHADLIQQEAAGNPVEVNLLLVHTEDQLLAAEQFQIIAIEFIDSYRKMETLSENRN